MKRIIYASQATSDFPPEELIALLEKSRSKNERTGLSGMLLYSSQSFLQVLEGDEEALAAAYARIRADARHTNLRLLMDAEVSAPCSPTGRSGWSASTTRSWPRD